MFFKSKDNDREELRGQIDSLMQQYAKEEIDGQTYMQKMMDVTSSYQEKHPKN
mgnify:CR=1 FL=1